MDIKKVQLLLKAKGIIISDDDFIFNFMSLYEVTFQDILEGSLEEVIEKQSKFNNAGKKSINIKKMQSILLLKGIRIKNDDPVFNMLGLNQIILENIAESYKDKLKQEYRHRMSMNSVKREKYIIYSTCLTIVIISFFFVKDVEWLRQGLILLIGILFGSATVLFFSKEKKSIAIPIAFPKKKDILDAWTEDEFNDICSRMIKPLSSRAIEACKMVLINQLSMDEAKIQYPGVQLQMSLYFFENQRERDILKLEIKE